MRSFAKRYQLRKIGPNGRYGSQIVVQDHGLAVSITMGVTPSETQAGLIEEAMELLCQRVATILDKR